MQTAVSGSGRRLAILHSVALTLFAVMVVVMTYGLYYFPAAPIRYVEGRFIDKRGEVHSREDFERLRIWERVFIASSAASIVSAALHQYAKRRDTSERR